MSENIADYPKMLYTDTYIHSFLKMLQFVRKFCLNIGAKFGKFFENFVNYWKVL